MKATINVTNGKRVITAYVNGGLVQAGEEHGNFDEIYEAIFESPGLLTDDELFELFDVSYAVGRRFKQVTERVSVADGTVYFDGTRIHSRLTDQILRFMKAGLDFSPLVNFFEKIEDNPNVHSRYQLYSWLERFDFTIAPDGNIIAYKGVIPDGDGFRSISRGRAVSDGVEYTGQIPQKVGSVVEMPRNEVTADPSLGCSYGLHAGTWDYAHGFSHGAVLTVSINPRDVVSVPTDCGFAKMRVSRYKVTGVTKVELQAPLFASAYDDDEPEADPEDFTDFDDWEYYGDFPVT